MTEHSNGQFPGENHRASSRRSNKQHSPPESLAAAERISRGICLAPFVSHRNYNSQGEQRSDRELRHQGQRSHLEVTFQSQLQMLPIYLSASPAPFPVTQPTPPTALVRRRLPTSPSSSPSLFGVFMFCTSFLRLPLQTPPSFFPLHTPSPTLCRADEAARRKWCNKRKR